MLVIVTTLIRPQLATPVAPAFSQQRHVAERFNLIAPDPTSQASALEDSAMLTAPIGFQYRFLRTDHAIFGSACHEGGYAIAHKMPDTRLIEQARAAEPAAKSKP